jgi:hypothetical protein
VPFHEVRTRFLGNVATPAMSASPIKMVEGLWGGELPVFDTIDATNELIGALVMGLWNRLTRHQERNAPFRLTRLDIAATWEGLATLALIRRECAKCCDLAVERMIDNTHWRDVPPD